MEGPHRSDSPSAITTINLATNIAVKITAAITTRAILFAMGHFRDSSYALSRRAISARWAARC